MEAQTITSRSTVSLSTVSLSTIKTVLHWFKVGLCGGGLVLVLVLGLRLNRFPQAFFDYEQEHRFTEHRSTEHDKEVASLVQGGSNPGISCSDFMSFDKPRKHDLVVEEKMCLHPLQIDLDGFGVIESHIQPLLREIPPGRILVQYRVC